MTDFHPLTQKILEVANVDDFHPGEDFEGGKIDALVREHTSLTLAVESGVAFPRQAPGAEVSVEATFVEPGNQMQMALIGSEPVLLLQPQYDADENTIRFILTAVALDPVALDQVVGIVKDAAEEMADVQRQQQAEVAEFEDRVTARRNALQASGPDEFPTGYYDHVARQEIAEADAALRKANEDFELAQLPETPEG